MARAGALLRKLHRARARGDRAVDRPVRRRARAAGTARYRARPRGAGTRARPPRRQVAAVKRHGPWRVLEIDPTEDRSAIQRAYAEKLKGLDPDSDIAGFTALRNARDHALTLARSLQAAEARAARPRRSPIRVRRCQAFEEPAFAEVAVLEHAPRSRPPKTQPNRRRQQCCSISCSARRIQRPAADRRGARMGDAGARARARRSQPVLDRPAARDRRLARASPRLGLAALGVPARPAAQAIRLARRDRPAVGAPGDPVPQPAAQGHALRAGSSSPRTRCTRHGPSSRSRGRAVPWRGSAPAATTSSSC